jgi:hypothetical protein
MFATLGLMAPDGRPIYPNVALKGSRNNNVTFLCADASCLAVLPKRRNISIFLRYGALPDRRFST